MAISRIPRLAIFSIVAVMLASAIAASARGQQVREIPLSVGSDGFGVYFVTDTSGGQVSPVVHGSSRVFAVLRNEINVFVNLGSSNGKTGSPLNMCVDLTMPITGAARGVYCDDLQSNTSDSQSLLALADGQTISKRFQITWQDGTGTYWLRFGSEGDTDDVALTCTEADGAGCLVWRVEPEGGTAGSAARLWHLPSAKRSTTMDLGTYHVPFGWTVQRN